jgi:hypothetical protein
MWVYYAFTATAVLFSAVVRQPLGSNATFYLALIFDIHGICVHLGPFSPAAHRIGVITQRMDDVGFKLIKSLSKKRAAEGDGKDGDSLKKSRAESVYAGSSRSVADSELLPEIREAPSGDDFGLTNVVVLEPPTNFVWEDWETWFNASVNFDI